MNSLKAEMKESKINGRINEARKLNQSRSHGGYD